MKTSHTLQQVEQAIASLDLAPIKIKLMDSHSGEGWTQEFADTVELWYRRFLLLSFKHRSKPIVVNDAIDTFWHYHILDTRKYAEDCEAVFGYFLHHFPYFGMRGEADSKNLQQCFGETMKLIEKEFGESLEAAFGSRWEAQNRPSRTGQPRFKGASCSDCGGGNNYSGDEDGLHTFFRDRPTRPAEVAVGTNS
jgi:hypothetical protein